MYKKALYTQIDADVYVAVKDIAKREQISMREAIENALKSYAESFEPKIKKKSHAQAVLDLLPELQYDDGSGRTTYDSENVDKIVYGIDK